MVNRHRDRRTCDVRGARAGGFHPSDEGREDVALVSGLVRRCYGCRVRGRGRWVVGPGQMVSLAVAREPVDHAEVVSHENRGELFEEVGERVASLLRLAS